MRARRVFTVGLALGLLLPLAIAAPSGAETPVTEMVVRANPITQFRIGYDDKQFGRLTFIGGLEMVSGSRDFGSLSSFRFLEPGGRFIGVADTGFWFFGKVEHDEDGRPVGFADFRMEEMVGEDGAPIHSKEGTDAEGIAVKNGVATVSFERRHRVAEFAIRDDGMRAATKSVNFLIPPRELRTNKGIETIVYAPRASPLEGARVVVSERSLDKAGDIFAAILEGPRKGLFSVTRNGAFDITDGAFLPSGDLLLLERSFSMATGVKMALRLIPQDQVAKGAVATGETLLTADMGYQIDNMEGLDVWRRADGKLIVSLLSDDNHSILQRNLYLEFELAE